MAIFLYFMYFQADVDANTIEAYIELEKAIAIAETQRWKGNDK